MSDSCRLMQTLLNFMYVILGIKTYQLKQFPSYVETQGLFFQLEKTPAGQYPCFSIDISYLYFCQNPNIVNNQFKSVLNHKIVILYEFVKVKFLISVVCNINYIMRANCTVHS